VIKIYKQKKKTNSLKIKKNLYLNFTKLWQKKKKIFAKSKIYYILFHFPDLEVDLMFKEILIK